VHEVGQKTVFGFVVYGAEAGEYTAEVIQAWEDVQAKVVWQNAPIVR
jgi:hypothetical protein